jgi:hypothetical protein
MTIKTNESIKKLTLDHITTKKLAFIAIVCRVSFQTCIEQDINPQNIYYGMGASMLVNDNTVVE